MVDNADPNAAVLNLEATLARFGGDEELLGEMAAILLDDAPHVMHDLKGAVKRRDATAIRGKAHALKGLILGCGGERAGHSAQLLEDAGHRNELKLVDTQIISLEHDLNQFLDALRARISNRVTA